MAFDDRPSDLYGEGNLASYSRESFTTVANSNAGGAIGFKLRPVLQAQLSSGKGFTDLRSLGHALPDSATAVGPWDSISATGGSGRRVGLVQEAELIRATLEMDHSLSVPAILREAALLVGTAPEGPLLVQACRASAAHALQSSTALHASARLCTPRTPPRPSAGGAAARLPRPWQRCLDAPAAADAGSGTGAAKVQRGCGGCGGRGGCGERRGCGERHAPAIP